MLVMEGAFSSPLPGFLSTKEFEFVKNVCVYIHWTYSDMWLFVDSSSVQGQLFFGLIKTKPVKCLLI
jgi:hypothetical protein